MRAFFIGAAMTGTIATIPKYQFLDSLGVPLVNGTLTTYLTGTTTLTSTWQDQAQASLNTNPIVLDARGEATLWLDPAIVYKFVLKNEAGATLWTQENISGNNSAAVQLRADLAASSGSSLVGFVQAETGAVNRTLESKNRDIAHRSDFNSDVNFNSAKGNKPNIDSAGSLNAKVKPLGENAQINLDEALLPVSGGARDAILYNSAQSVKVFRNHAQMGGFRFRGQYSKGRAPVFAMPASKVVTSPGSLSGMTAKTNENWYAVFACANDGDATATLKMVPFLKAGIVAGSDIPLVKAGEGIIAPSSQSYAWTTTNNFANVDCMCISESGGYSGRVAKITANSASSLTLDTIGSVVAGDYLLPAPTGFKHYVYIASFYFDTSEVRNIADTGVMAKGKMIYLQYPSVQTGAIAAPGAVFNCAGYISPLATGVVVDSSCSLSTASTGAYGEYFDTDGSNHITTSTYFEKTTASSSTVVFFGVQIPFNYFQTFNFYNAGALASTRINGQLNIVGWIEP